MNILIDAHGLVGQPAGKAFYTKTLILGLARLPESKRHKFVLISPREVSLGKSLPKNFSWQITGAGFSFYWKLLRMIRSKEVDVVWSPTSYITSYVGGSNVVSVVYDLASFQHLPFEPNSKAKIIETILLKRLLHSSRHFITLSTFTSRELQQRFKVHGEKISIIPGSPRQFPHPSPLTTIKKRYKIKLPYLLFVGTLEPRKNLVNTLIAYRMFLDRLKLSTSDKPHFILAGGSGWGHTHLFSYLKRLRLHRYVRLVGYLPEQDLAALYQHCLFLVYVPWYEGFGLPIVEAFSFGKAVVTCTSSSLPEVAGRAGLLANPVNPSDIANKLYQLFTDIQLHRTLEASAGKEVQRFSTKLSAKKLLAVLTA